MPKGDRLKLKADPEDGTTPIANLLLEAVAMAKISGLQKGAILYLWRRTYGWVENGERLKERKITLLEWANALDTTKPRVSTTLAELEAKGIMKRRMADAWGGYYYSINTHISSWNSNCLNIAKLSEMIIVPNLATVTENRTIPQTDNSSINEQQLPNTEQLPKTLVTVTQNGTEQLPKTELPTLYKERLNKDIKKEGCDVLLKQPPPLDDLKDTVSKIVEKSPYGVRIRQVFTGLLEKRGYKTPKNQAEAKAIRNMLKNGYTPDQILSTWETLKADNFWQGRELYMNSVEKQIGAMLKDGAHQGSDKGYGNARRDNTQSSQPRDYTGGKYGHMVKS